MGILGVISAQTMWIFKRLKRTKPGKARAETPTMVGYRIGTGWRNPHRSGVCFQPPRNPHQGGEVFASAVARI